MYKIRTENQEKMVIIKKTPGPIFNLVTGIMKRMKINYLVRYQ